MSLEKHPRLKKALDSFTQEYCANPFKYLYEVDAQVLLSKHLEEEFQEMHEIIGQQGDKKGKKFDIGKVHREYPRYPKSMPIDNVVLGNPRQYPKDQLTDIKVYENFYEQPIDYAIELKLVYLDEVRNIALDVSIDDYRRFVESKLPILLKNYEFKYGLQLTLFQSHKEHDEKFLKNLRNPKWESHYAKKREDLFEPSKGKFGLYYIDMNKARLTPVWT